MSAPSRVDVLAAQVRDGIGAIDTKECVAAWKALDALVGCVTAAERDNEQCDAIHRRDLKRIKQLSGWYDGAEEHVTELRSKVAAAEAALADARNALHAIANGYDDPQSVAYRAGFVGQRQIAREVLARLDGGQE